MATKRTTAPPPAAATPPRPPYMLIEEIRVQGYKSLVDATLHVRPLTLLAGTNSSGKSSIMQPLLLIKQTMEALYQPAGALLLSGAHVQAEIAGELVSKIGGKRKRKSFEIKLLGPRASRLNNPTVSIDLVYGVSGNQFVLSSQIANFITGYNFKVELTPGISWERVVSQFPAGFLRATFGSRKRLGRVEIDQGFLRLDLLNEDGSSLVTARPAGYIQKAIASCMHIPGLRGKPQRSYPATFFQAQVRGTFDLYAAGTISQWQQINDSEKIDKLNASFQLLGLTDSIIAETKNANEIELSANRLPVIKGEIPDRADMVNIADVGIGVSQVLPILVALIAAQDGQLVYVEQPELHLHPRAQVVMAELLAEAAKRGVRVIVETHSSLLLLTVQTLVAEGELKPEQVGLHWFARDAKGATTVTLAEVDENGAYGDWPEDFGDVELTAQSAYLNANTKRQPFKPAAHEA